MGLIDSLKGKYEIHRLEKRYTRRDKRTTFTSDAIYVDGEYIYAPNNKHDNDSSSNISSRGNGDNNNSSDNSTSNLSSPSASSKYSSSVSPPSTPFSSSSSECSSPSPSPSRKGTLSRHFSGLPSLPSLPSLSQSQREKWLRPNTCSPNPPWGSAGYRSGTRGLRR